MSKYKLPERPRTDLERAMYLRIKLRKAGVPVVTAIIDRSREELVLTIRIKTEAGQVNELISDGPVDDSDEAIIKSVIEHWKKI